MIPALLLPLGLAALAALAVPLVIHIARRSEQLPTDFREAIVLREIEGLSYKEIASVLGVPIGTVMSRLARARERLLGILRLAPPLEMMP